jgi:hypothetical protein
MRVARSVALVLVLYLAADFLDASAPGVFVFDSAFFLGTVVQSKVRSGDATEYRSTPAPLPLVNSSPSQTVRASVPAVRRTSVLVETYAPLPRDATRRPNPPGVAEDQ